MTLDEHLIKHLIRPEVLAMNAYKVADASGFIKLDAMENPYAWPAAMLEEWLAILKDSPMNRYPDPEAKMLAQSLRQQHQVPDPSQLILGNGSDEIIQILLMALKPDACVLSPEPGFVMYRQISRSLGLKYVGVDLNNENFQLDMAAMRRAIEQHKPAIIFLAYPNNPTGNLFDADDVREIIELAPGLVVVDEAYAPFADASFMPALTRYSNLLIMRTVSKLGLAGLRLGYLAGDAKIVEQLNKIRLPYNINCLTQASVSFALQHETIFLEQSQKICADRELMLQQLNALDSLKCYPSRANFILFKALKLDANELFQALKNEKILIKNLSPQGGALSNCLRVTIGNTNENKTFIKALKRTINSIIA